MLNFILSAFAGAAGAAIFEGVKRTIAGDTLKSLLSSATDTKTKVSGADDGVDASALQALSRGLPGIPQEGTPLYSAWCAARAADRVFDRLPSDKRLALTSKSAADKTKAPAGIDQLSFSRALRFRALASAGQDTTLAAIASAAQNDTLARFLLQHALQYGDTNADPENPDEVAGPADVINSILNPVGSLIASFNDEAKKKAQAAAKRREQKKREQERKRKAAEKAKREAEARARASAARPARPAIPAPAPKAAPAPTPAANNATPASSSAPVYSSPAEERDAYSSKLEDWIADLETRLQEVENDPDRERVQKNLQRVKMLRSLDVTKPEIAEQLQQTPIVQKLYNRILSADDMPDDLQEFWGDSETEGAGENEETAGVEGDCAACSRGEHDKCERKAAKAKNVAGPEDDMGGPEDDMGGPEDDMGASPPWDATEGPEDDMSGPEDDDMGGPEDDMGASPPWDATEGPEDDMGASPPWDATEGPEDDMGGPEDDMGGPEDDDMGGPEDDDMGGPEDDMGASPPWDATEGPEDDMGGPEDDMGGPEDDMSGPEDEMSGPEDDDCGGVCGPAD